MSVHSLGPARFALRFLALFALLVGAAEAGRGTSLERWIVDDAFLAPAAALLAVLAPADRVVARDRALVSPLAKLRVLRGCEGTETLLLVVAAVLAFPATLAERAAGLALGATMAWALSVLRLAGLYLGLRHWPDGFELSHGLIAPLAPVVVLALFFVAWSGDAARRAVARAALTSS